MCDQFVHLVLFLSMPGAVQEPDKAVFRPATGDAIGNLEPPAWGTLVGSTESNKYHRPRCKVALRVRAENAIWFTDVLDATENGYVAAGCKSRDCRPPLPPVHVPLGELGGALLPPPDPNPPSITPPTPATQSSGKPNASTTPAKEKPAGTAAARVPPPRLPRPREVATYQLLQVWQGVPIAQELDARRRWEVWAEWALDRWCERWHVSPSGRINTDSAYTQKTEQLLLAKLKAMKEQIEDNRKRMKELKAVLDGKKKPGEK